MRELNGPFCITLFCTAKRKGTFDLYGEDGVSYRFFFFFLQFVLKCEETLATESSYELPGQVLMSLEFTASDLQQMLI